MASLKIVSDRTDDNALKFAVVLPPRRNGEVNFGAAEAINRALLTINPDAYDPQEVAAEVIALADGVTATGAGLIPPDIAAAMIRDRVLELDDDTGAPGEPPRCSTGGCDGG
jgi:hypothetical protein